MFSAFFAVHPIEAEHECPQAGLSQEDADLPTAQYRAMHSALAMLAKSGRIDTEDFCKCLHKEQRAGEPSGPLLETLVMSNIVVVDELQFVEFDSRAARWYAANKLLQPPPALPPPASPPTLLPPLQLDRSKCHGGGGGDGQRW